MSNSTVEYHIDLSRQLLSFFNLEGFTSKCSVSEYSLKAAFIV